MRVGILTFHTVLNYGALLQAYALQNVILKMGHECEIIDYRSGYFNALYRPVRAMDLKHPKAFLRRLEMIPNNVRLRNAADKFVEEKLILSQLSYSGNNISECEKDYDVIITGSDQVWNMSVNGKDTVYFLDFVKDGCKKASYAASMASVKLSEDEKAFFVKQLSGYKNISVRETDSREILENILQRDISVDIDPTLLIDRQEWYDISEEMNDEKYVLVYLMSLSDNILEYALRLAKEKNLKVKFINLYLPRVREGIESVFAPEVKDWISLFRNSEYVINNSFHGLAFAVIFNKKFIYEMVDNAGKNTRITSIMNSLGIEKRFLDEKNIGSIDNCIDYVKTEQILSVLRENSMQYLKKIVS